MTTVTLPAVYVDALSEVEDGDLTGEVHLSSRIPQPLELDVPINAPIEIIANIVNDDGLSAGTITVTDPDGSVVAWTFGGGFHASYTANSLHNSVISQGAVSSDEFRWQLVRATNWESEAKVSVRVQLTPTTGAAIDVTYFFTIEDITVPTLASAESRGLKRLRLVFNEPVDMSLDGNGALRVRDISGRLAFTAPDAIEVEATSFPTNLTGDYICVAGSEEAVNNRYFKVATATPGKPSEITTVEQTIVAEEPQIEHRLFAGPYLLHAVIPLNSRIPAYTPCIVAAEQIDSRTIELELDQALTAAHTYQLTAVSIGDAADPSNVRDTMSVTFISEALRTQPGRKFSFWDFVPQGNKRDDTTGDLERLVRILDEPVQQMLADTDNYGEIYDIDTMDAAFVDALLLHLGNPYAFLRNDLEKRKVAAHLVETFKVSGSDAAIEQSILQILGYAADVQPLNSFENQWVLGESELGIDSYLGPSEINLIYSFEVDVFVTALTAEEQTIIQEICDTWRPAHTHCIRINSVGAAP